LGPRLAWTGNSGGWLPALINLPPNAAGQTVQVRWHFATSRGLANGGWFISPVLVTEPLCLPPVTNPLMVNPAVHDGLFMFGINTVTSRTYLVEFKTNLTDNAWQLFQTLSGDGTLQNVSVPSSSAPQSFYRFRVP
jgi:hypothetical protein